MTKIEWTDQTWNPATGCTKVSQGCKNCYAEKVFPRTVHGQYVEVKPVQIGQNGTTLHRPRKFTDVRTHDNRLEYPLRWKKPRMVFVNSMSDMFHEDIPEHFIDKVFAVMALTPQHTFQVLTKRAKRMRDYLVTLEHEDQIERWYEAGLAVTRDPHADEIITGIDYPLRNVWLGASVEDQPTADERIPLLLQTPAAVRFVSYEPALGPVTFTGISSVPACFNALLVGRYPRLDWVIVGGESGPKARPFDITWARSTVGQCRDAGVPVFIKQLGARPYEKRPADGGPHGTHEALRAIGRPHPQCNWYKDWTLVHTPDGESNWYKYLALANSKGGDMAEWPEDLRVREFPRVA